MWGSSSRIRCHWCSSSSRSGPKSSGRSISSKYSGSGPTQSEAITTRPSSVSTSSEIRPLEWPGRQDPAHARLDLALLAGQLRSCAPCRACSARSRCRAPPARSRARRSRAGANSISASTWSKWVCVRITLVVVRLDAALAQRAGHRRALHHHAGVDDVVLARRGSGSSSGSRSCPRPCPRAGAACRCGSPPPTSPRAAARRCPFSSANT